MVRFISLLFFSFVFSIGLSATQSNEHQIRSLFAGLEARDAPGAAILILQDGKVVLQHGFGVTDLRSHRQIGEHTNFRLASLTKQFTAMAIMLLVHDGKLTYETPLTDVFRDFPGYGKGITIRHLLNHTSGLLDYENLMPKNFSPDVQIQDAEVLDLLKRQTTTKFAPGTQWDYSNSGYVLLGEIVARTSGAPFREFLRERIFSPLNMNQTIVYQKGKNEVQERAFGHSRIKGAWQETDQSATSATLGDGGIYSSVSDLARWDRALREHTLLTVSETEAWTTPVVVPIGSAVEPGGTPAAYGFGWFLNSYRGHERMWHYGESIGFRTAIHRFTDDKLTVIILGNRNDLNPTELALKIADLHFGVRSPESSF